MDLAEAAERVYAAGWDEFVTVRGDLVKQARAAKDKELATRIGQLRKPSRSGWLVNQWVRRRGAEVDQLFDLADLLGEAHRSLAADDLRTLTAQRRKLIMTLTRSVITVGAELGHRASQGTTAEVSELLTGVLTNPAVAERVRTGTVLASGRAAGFGPADLFGEGAKVIQLRRPARRTDSGRGAPEPEVDPGPDPAVVAELQDRLGAVAAKVGTTEAAVRAARERSDLAAQQATEAERTLELARQAVTDAETAVRRRTTARDKARAEVPKAEQAAAAVRKELNAIAAELARLTSG